METLDRNVLLLLLGHLALRDLGRIGQVCRSLRALSSHDALYQHRFEVECASPMCCIFDEPYKAESRTWRWRCENAKPLTSVASLTSVNEWRPVSVFLRGGHEYIIPTLTVRRKSFDMVGVGCKPAVLRHDAAVDDELSVYETMLNLVSKRATFHNIRFITPPRERHAPNRNLVANVVSVHHCDKMFLLSCFC